MERSRLLKLFLEEARLNVLRARDLLEDTSGIVAPDRLSELKRIAHSVKGMASTVGEESIAHAMHEAEERLAEIEAAESGVSENDLSALSAPLIESFRGSLGRLVALEQELSGHGDPAERPAEPTARVAIDADKLDRLLELSSELAASHQRLEHGLGPVASTPALFEARSLLESSIASLREEVLELRWTPVRDLVPTLEETLVRAAERTGVRVSFVVQGRATRIDRAVFQGLVEPLRQLVRNAVVHGIEPPEERARAGKPERGVVRVRFEKTGSRLTITITDDGRGIDRRALGLDATAVGPRDPLLAMLTRPGVTRRRVADHDAGRGIGLAAVQSDLWQLGGNLELESLQGQGFTARLSVPLTVSSMEAFVARSDGRCIVIPVDAVERVGATSGDERPLAHSLGFEPQREVVGHAPEVTIELVGTKPLFAVDQLEGPSELIVRPLDAPIVSGSRPWSGVALLPTGGIALVIDPVRVRRMTRLAAAGPDGAG